MPVFVFCHIYNVTVLDEGGQFQIVCESNAREKKENQVSYCSECNVSKMFCTFMRTFSHQLVESMLQVRHAHQAKGPVQPPTQSSCSV